MASLRRIETNIRVYRGINVTPGTIGAGIMRQFYFEVNTALHQASLEYVTPSRYVGASLLSAREMTEVRRSSAALRTYTAEQVADELNEAIPETGDHALPIRLNYLEIVPNRSLPEWSDIVLGFENDTFDKECAAVQKKLGNLAIEQPLSGEFAQIRLGHLHHKVPEHTRQLLRSIPPRNIDLEPVLIGIFKS